MKKLLLLTLMAASTQMVNAQVLRSTTGRISQRISLTNASAAMRGAAVGDTVKGMLNFSATQLSSDSLIAYRVDAVTPADSGYVYGPNAFGDKGWAERFDFSTRDSSLKVIGTFAIFDGVYTANSTKTINMKVWSQGPKTAISSPSGRLSYNGFPNNVLATQSVSIRNLGISPASINDTLKYIAFATPTAFLTDSFFVGYDPNYTFAQAAGDSIGLKSTRNGYRYAPYYYAANGDTSINVKNASLFADGTWADNSFSNFQLDHHLAIFPVVVVGLGTGSGVGINGVTQKNLTFYGNYPNPAVGNTNIKFGLKQGADVTIVLTDMTGRQVHTIAKNNLGAGEHVINISTADLAAGDYIYLVRTSAGDGMGAQMTVIK